MFNFIIGVASGVLLLSFVLSLSEPKRNAISNPKPEPQTRIIPQGQEVIDGREMVVLRDTQTNTDYLYYGGGITKLEKP